MYVKYRLIGLVYHIFRRVSYPGNNSLLTWHQERTVVSNYRIRKKKITFFLVKNPYCEQ
jgi:hypothetical protein